MVCHIYTAIGQEDNDNLTCVAMRKRVSRKNFCVWLLWNLLVHIFIKYLFFLFPSFYRKVAYERCTIAEATHILVEDEESNELSKIHEYRIEEDMPSSPDVKLKNVSMGLDTIQDSYYSNESNFKYFNYKNQRYFWSSQFQEFRVYKGFNCLMTLRNIYDNTNGISDKLREMRLNVYGENIMNIQVKSFIVLFLGNLLDPFYIIQVYVSTEIEVKQPNNEFKKVLSSSLVPGDIISVPPGGSLVPCDCVLISGNVIVNESMLTGECFPTTKIPLNFADLNLPETLNSSCISRKPRTISNNSDVIQNSEPDGEKDDNSSNDEGNDADKKFSTIVNKTNTLYCGTVISQLRSFHDSKVLAMVIGTGFATYKGVMIHSVLHPKKLGFAFFRDSIKFMLIMFFVAVCGVAYSLYVFINFGSSVSLMIRKSLDIITIVVPPGLPASLTVATMYSLKRLKSKNISCIDSTRINICGKLKAFCFDKTGTLTEEIITVSGLILPTDEKCTEIYTSTKGRMDDLIQNKNFNNIETISQPNIPSSKKFAAHIIESLDDPHVDFHVVQCMASCHGLCLIDGTIIGDPIDTVMFDFVKWSLSDSIKFFENRDSNSTHGTAIDNARIDAFSNSNEIYPIMIPPCNNFTKSSIDNKTLQDVNSNVLNYIFSLFMKVTIKNDFLKFEPVVVMKVYQFESELQRMSVLVRTLNTKNYYVYAKGSPEAIRNLCTPESIPDGFENKFFDYAEKGYRIIALSYKEISENTPYHKVMRFKRNDAEAGMTFMGFLLFHNKLKKMSKSVIKKLTKNHTRVCMVTGDNILTAMSIGCECGIINMNQPLVEVTAHVRNPCLEEMDEIDDVQHFHEDSNNDENIVTHLTEIDRPIDRKASQKSNVNLNNHPSSSSVEYNDANSDVNNDEEYINNEPIDSRCDIQINSSTDVDFHIKYTEMNHERFIIDHQFIKLDKRKKKSKNSTSNDYLKQLVIDGQTFGMVRKYANRDEFDKIITSGVIFARMSPQQKAELVKDMQALGYVVAMVGDGANDCGALKAAHAGIVLATSEASVVSPFTTREGCLTSVTNLIKEGRISLVTAFSMFIFIIMYSLTQFITVLILYIHRTNLSDFQFLLIDLLLLAPIVTTMVAFKPAAHVVKKRPLGRLVHPQIFFSIAGQFILQLGLLIYVTKRVSVQPWYIPAEYISEESLEFVCHDNAVIFTAANFMYIFQSIAVSIGPPYRELFLKNTTYLICIIGSLFFCGSLIYYPGVLMQSFFLLDTIPTVTFRNELFFVSISFGILTVLWQVLITHVKKIKDFVNLFRFKRCHRNKYKKVISDIKADTNWPQDVTQKISIGMSEL